MEWLKAAFSNNQFLFFFAIIGIPMICMSLTEIVKVLIKHRERMAMIEHGMDPNAHEPRKTAKREACKSSDSTPSATAPSTTETVK